VEGAIAAYKEVIRLQKDCPKAHTNLGLALHEKGDLDGAITEYRKALATRQDFREAYKAHGSLGNALRDKGEVDGAIAAYREAVCLKKDDPWLHGYLGLALWQQGQFAESRAAFRRAGNLLTPSNPVYAELAGYASSCERLLALEKRLPALLAGNEEPKNNADRLALAQYCNVKKLHARAAQFFAASFAADAKLADDLKAGHRYNAARAAGGAGKDAAKLSDAERAGFRKQALDWLQADLDVWRKLLNKEPDKHRTTVARKMQHWLRDADFRGVRGQEALSKLPEAERPAWQQLWADVAATLARAREQGTPGPKEESQRGSEQEGLSGHRPAEPQVAQLTAASTPARPNSPG
jgi:tetratricopeptide (TPR) repeat protein